MAKDYIQKYLWRDHSQPFLKAWQITLTADEAIAFMAAVCVLISYTQAKTWNLARRAIVRIVRPIQLPLDEDDESNPLAHLSQYRAISDLMSKTQRLWRATRQREGTSQTIPSSRTRDNLTMTKISPLFGIAAMVNTVLFIVMGVLILWLLTGGLETPIVQLKWCADPRGRVQVGGDDTSRRSSNEPSFWLKHFTTSDNTQNSNLFALAETYRQCWRSLSNPTGWSATVVEEGPCPRVDGAITNRPSLRVTQQPPSCDPFDVKDCLVDELSQIELSRDNLTMRDYGLNVAGSLFTHSRRLTCTPMPEVAVSIIEKPRDFVQTTSTPGATKLDSELETSSPPVSSIETIDHDQVHETRTSTGSLTVHYTEDGRLECPSCAKHLDEHLHGDEGEAFLVLYRPGKLGLSGYAIVTGLLVGIGVRVPVRFIGRGDPLRLGGKSDDGPLSLVRCQEQHSICLRSDDASSPKNKTTDIQFCTPFSNILNATKEMFQYVELLNDNGDEAKEQLGALSDLFHRSSTVSLLFEELSPRGIVPTWSDFRHTPWTFKVLHLFEQALLLTQLNLHATTTGELHALSWGTDLITPNVTETGWTDLDEAASRAMFPGAAPYIPARHMDFVCRSGLALDSDYTNINMVGLVMALFVMVCINTVCHWQGHKTAARAVVIKVVAMVGVAFSVVRKDFTKLYQDSGIVLSPFVDTFSSRFHVPALDHHGPQSQSSRQRNHSTNPLDQGISMDLTPR